MKIKVIHKKGKHYANIWGSLALSLASFFSPTVRLLFTEKSKHQYPNNETDWSKVFGRGSIAYSKDPDEGRPGHRYETLLAWRYRSDKGVFEWTRYWREDYDWDYEDPRELKAGDVSPPIKTKFKGIKPLPPHFGGNHPAPQTIEYFVLL